MQKTFVLLITTLAQLRNNSDRNDLSSVGYYDPSLALFNGKRVVVIRNQGELCR